MNGLPGRTALIVGAGDGLSASLARLFAKNGMAVGLAARNPDKLEPLCREIGAQSFCCDASQVECNQMINLHRRSSNAIASSAKAMIYLEGDRSDPRVRRI